MPASLRCWPAVRGPGRRTRRGSRAEAVNGPQNQLRSGKATWYVSRNNAGVFGRLLASCVAGRRPACRPSLYNNRLPPLAY